MGLSFSRASWDDGQGDCGKQGIAGYKRGPGCDDSGLVQRIEFGKRSVPTSGRGERVVIFKKNIPEVACSIRPPLPDFEVALLEREVGPCFSKVPPLKKPSERCLKDLNYHLNPIREKKEMDGQKERKEDLTLNGTGRV